MYKVEKSKEKSIPISVGIKLERYEEMKEQIQEIVSRKIVEGLRKVVKDPLQDEGFSSYDLLKATEGIPQTPAECFMAGIIFCEIVAGMKNFTESIKKRKD